MRVELRVEARQDLADGAWFYDRQKAGLGDYFIECGAADLATLESQSGIHEIELLASIENSSIDSRSPFKTSLRSLISTSHQSWTVDEIQTRLRNASEESDSRKRFAPQFLEAAGVL